MARNENVEVENLVTFELGHAEDGIVLLLAYATSQERLSKGEMDSFAIGMTHEKAVELGKALLGIADTAPVPDKRQTEH